MARVGFSTGSLSLFEIARQSYELIPDVEDNAPSFKDWCAKLYERRKQLYVLEFTNTDGKPLENINYRFAGLAIAFPVDNITMRVDWLVCRRTAVFKAFLGIAKAAHIGIQFLEFERINNQRPKRYSIARLERLLNKIYGK